jgi:hypothetical protein
VMTASLASRAVPSHCQADTRSRPIWP